MVDRHSVETAVDRNNHVQQSPVTSEKKNGNAVATSDKPAGEKKPGESGNIQESTVGRDAFYDPSKESRMTRLGLTGESFKRAPGTTGGQHGENVIPFTEQARQLWILIKCKFLSE